jgi:hypothetical protein
MKEDDRISIQDWIRNFRGGMYDAKDRDAQINAGWYDWFCKDTSLAAKTQKLGKKLVQVVEKNAIGGKFDPKKTYVWFKNNCPMNGSLYDDFRIADMKTGDTLYTITPSNGHRIHKGKADVWGRKENDFTEALVEGTWKDVLQFFMKD